MTKYTRQMFVDYGLTQMDFAEIVATAEANAGDANGNATILAESVANDLGHDEWLDIETHPIWDVAVDVIEEEDDDAE